MIEYYIVHQTTTSSHLVQHYEMMIYPFPFKKKIFLPIRVSIIIQTSLSCAVIWNINVIKSSPQINLICLSGSLREATLNMMSKWVFQYDKLKW